MEPNFARETIKINKLIFNQTIEQDLEFDYQLPDYCTGIFKVLQFKAEPHICSLRSAAEQFTIDGNTIIKLIYIDEEEGNIKSISQNIPFSKTIKLNESLTEPCVFHQIDTNYANCKIVSSKKIEVKGSLTINLKIYDRSAFSILQNLNDEETTKTGIHLKQQPLNLTYDQTWVNQQFKASEQIELENPIGEILDIKINIIENENKIISNKIIVKATTFFTIVYCSPDNKTSFVKKTTSSINQILEMPNVNEQFLCNIFFDVSSVSNQVLQDGKTIKIDFDGFISGYSFLSKTVNFVTDVFSTKFELTPKTKKINLINTIGKIKENLTLTETFSAVNFKQIIDINSQFLNLEYELLNNCFNFKAKLIVHCYGITPDNTPEIFEKSVPVSFKIKNNFLIDHEILSKINLIANIKILDIDYELDLNRNLNLKISLNLNGLISQINEIETIDSVDLNLKEPKLKSNAAITLFYPQKNDDIWKIAKQFSTCPKEIIEANNLTNETINDEVMLIIPIV